jgi:hypothetical protein
VNWRGREKREKRKKKLVWGLLSRVRVKLRYFSPLLAVTEVSFAALWERKELECAVRGRECSSEKM